MNTTKLVAVVLGVAFIASLFTSIYFYSQNGNLNNELNTANSQNAALGQGTFIRNGTTFDEIGLQLNTLSNGTTVFFRGVGFTYIQRNYNMTAGAATFKIDFGASGTETLTVIDTGATTAKTSEVYTHYQDPRAGLGMNLGDPSKVFLFVSVYS